LEVLSDFRRNLMIRHLVSGFHSHEASTAVGFLEPLLQFPLGLTGTEYQKGLGMTNTRNDRLTVDVEMGRKRFLAAVARRYLCFWLT
jgi:hypothetical protein